jgi:putative ABC transport system permease protein
LYDVKPKEGKIWKNNFEANIGADVAKIANLKIGDTFYSTHGFLSDGMNDHEHGQFKVVGIYQKSNSVIDQLILTTTQSIWEVHDNHEHEEEEKEEEIPAEEAEEFGDEEEMGDEEVPAEEGEEFGGEDEEEVEEENLDLESIIRELESEISEQEGEDEEGDEEEVEEEYDIDETVCEGEDEEGDDEEDAVEEQSQSSGIGGGDNKVNVATGKDEEDPESGPGHAVYSKVSTTFNF